MAHKRLKSTIKLNASGIPVRKRGQGRLFLSKGCRNFIAEWYDSSGRRRCKSTGTPNLAEAEAKLAVFMEDTRRGLMPLAGLQKITFDELVEDVFDSYITKGQTSLKNVRLRWTLHLAKHFSGMRAAVITVQDVEEYKSMRGKAGAARTSINRELALLRRCLTLGVENEKVQRDHIPVFHLYNERDSIRQGFLTQEGYTKMAEACAKRGLWMRTFLELSWTLGWRLKEILNLKVARFNSPMGTLRLEPNETKNRRGREAGLGTVALALVRQCCLGKGPNDFILTRSRKRPVRNIYRVWASCAVEAGQGEWICEYCKTPIIHQPVAPELLKRPKRGKPWRPFHYYCPECDRRILFTSLGYKGLRPHDMRRSFAKNMLAAMVPETVIRHVAGWESDSAFQRYALRDVGTTKLAQQRLEAHLAAMARAAAELSVESSAGYADNAGKSPEVKIPALMN